VALLTDTEGATISIEDCWECRYTLLAGRASQEILLEYEDRIARLTLIPGADGSLVELRQVHYPLRASA
jgi:predicted Rdx family selenoprotein